MNHSKHNFIYILNAIDNCLFDIETSVIAIDRKEYLSDRSVQRYMNSNIPVKGLLIYNEEGFFETYQNKAFCYILIYKLEKIFNNEKIISKEYAKEVLCNNINLNDYTSYLKPFLSFQGMQNLYILTNSMTKEEVKIDYEAFIFNSVAECFNIPENEFRFSLSRKREYVDARFAAMWCFKNYGKYSLSKIGRLFTSDTGKGKDHSTVISGLAAYSDLIETSNTHKEIHNKLTNVIEQYL